MSHSRIFRTLKVEVAEEKQKKIEYGNEGIIKGTEHAICDGFKQPWNFIKHKNTVSKIALTPLAVADNLVRAALTPVSIPLTALNLTLYKLNHKLEDKVETVNRPSMSK